MIKKYLVYVLILCLVLIGSLVMGGSKKPNTANRGGPTVDGTTPGRH